jgi:hypothetical protein
MRLRRILNIVFLTVLPAGFILLAGCAAASTPGSEAHDATSPEADMGEMDHDETEDAHGTAVRQFIPNDGAEVKITSPANDATFARTPTFR